MILKVLLSGLILFFLLFSACGHLFNIASPRERSLGRGLSLYLQQRHSLPRLFPKSE